MSVSVEDLIEYNLEVESLEDWIKEVKNYKVTGELIDAKYISNL